MNASIPPHLKAQQTFDETLIPPELKASPTWVMWEYQLNNEGKWRKTPLYVTSGGHIRKALSTNPDTWMPYELAAGFALQLGYGLNFVLSKHERLSNPYVGIDIDLPADHPLVADIIASIGTYTEISPSGNGVRMFLRGRVPGERKRRGEFEIYDDQKTLSVTGNALPGCNLDIIDANTAFDEFYATHVAQDDETLDPRVLEQFTPTDVSAINEILDAALKSGGRGARLIELFETGAYTGQVNTNGSEVDYYFLVLAAGITGNQPALLSDLYRASALYRTERGKKWDRANYQTSTLNRALTAAAASALKNEFKRTRSEPPHHFPNT